MVAELVRGFRQRSRIESGVIAFAVAGIAGAVAVSPGYYYWLSGGMD